VITGDLYDRDYVVGNNDRSVLGASLLDPSTLGDAKHAVFNKLRLAATGKVLLVEATKEAHSGFVVCASNKLVPPESNVVVDRVRFARPGRFTSITTRFLKNGVAGFVTV
jgi:hypothetical protein